MEKYHGVWTATCIGLSTGGEHKSGEAGGVYLDHLGSKCSCYLAVAFDQQRSLGTTLKVDTGVVAPPSSGSIGLLGAPG